MFDIGWTELLLIGVVALIVVGPKDLPIMFRRLGQFTAKARGMAREFQRAMEQAADDAGVKDVSRDLRDLTSPKKMGLDKLKEATRDMGSIGTKAGSATRKLAEERAEKAARVREATAKAAPEQKATESAPATATPAETAPVQAKAQPAAEAVPDATEGAKTDG
jgi:sec-independent protein translocase protein TatB